MMLGDRTEQMQQRVNDDARLVWRGRFVNTTFLIEVGETSHLVEVLAGQIKSIRPGPFVMPSWSFALRAVPEAWEKFCSAEPPPGFHDLFALTKRRVLRIEGDIYPFMSNLYYFKCVMATLRPVVVTP